MTIATVAVLVERQYQVLEVHYPVLRLREAGLRAIVVAPHAGQTYLAKCTYPVVSDAAADAVTATDLAGVIVPGGWAPDYLRRSPAVVSLVRNVHDEGGLVAAICHGPWLLCSAGILRGRRVTSFSAIRDDVSNAGAEWVDEAVVRDGRLVTSRTPDDLPDFMRVVLDVLAGR